MCSAAGEVKFLQNVENRKASTPTSVRSIHVLYLQCSVQIHRHSPISSRRWMEDDAAVDTANAAAASDADADVVFSSFFVFRASARTAFIKHIPCIAVFWACALRSSGNNAPAFVFRLLSDPFGPHLSLFRARISSDTSEAVSLSFCLTISCNFSFSRNKTKSVGRAHDTPSKCAA